MSGVFGIFDSGNQDNILETANKMAGLFKHFDWTICETEVVNQRVVLGRTGINVFNKSPQPVYNSGRDIALVMSGEIYNLGLFPKNSYHTTDIEHQLLWLYETEGISFISKLNGVFILAIWDGQNKKIVLANDHMGFYPTYYYLHEGNFIFSPEVKGILCFPGFNKKLDMVALSQVMRFQHLLGDRTFFEDIFLLPPATILSFDIPTGNISTNNYWSFADLTPQKGISFEDAVDETGRLLRKAISRLTEGEYRPGISLSGGLDSRTILGMTRRRPITTLTYGGRDCFDVIYAGRIAKIAGSDHHWFDLEDGQWVLDTVDQHMELTEGFHSWIHSHGINILPQARQWIDVHLTGWDGGTVMGHNDSIEPQQINTVDNTALLNRLFYLFNQKYTWPSITEGEEKFLYHDSIKKNLSGLAFDSFRDEFQNFTNLRQDIRGEVFYIRNHCRRLTQNLNTFYQAFIEVRYPFFDYDLLEFLYSLPSEIRGHKKLYRSVIQKEIPRYVWVPDASDRIFPSSSNFVREVHSLWNKSKNKVNQYTFKIFPEPFTLYADYENYLRYELREWAEGILFDSRTIERGIFNPDFLKTLMNRHLSLNEEWTIGKIAPIITYEMMLRKYYDA